jgi:hypothetical protein
MDTIITIGDCDYDDKSINSFTILLSYVVIVGTICGTCTYFLFQTFFTEPHEIMLSMFFVMFSFWFFVLGFKLIKRILFVNDYL